MRSLQTLPLRISCFSRLLGGLANLLQSGLKLEGLSYSCQGETSTELRWVRGEQTWEFTPKSFFHGKGSGDTTRSRVFY